MTGSATRNQGYENPIYCAARHSNHTFCSILPLQTPFFLLLPAQDRGLDFEIRQKPGMFSNFPWNVDISALKWSSKSTALTAVR